jgi:succinate dehydrogenase/fumarate reductase flavoprotein subunit
MADSQENEKLYNSIIIGSGAAALNCALELFRHGMSPKEILIITENLGGGTSFDAGSDKQTYYKLSQVHADEDSPLKMAKSLYSGGAMHGDIALVESTVSSQAFMNLVNIGVPFPHDAYGTYVGYKTDNDPLQRGTSAGPLTSHLMAKTLLEKVKEKHIQIINKCLVIEVLKNSNHHACGVLAIDIDTLSEVEVLSHSILKSIIKTHIAKNVILATGGPAGMYKNSVYPISQWGSTSLAIKTGAKLQNLTDSQYGLASLKFRWNVSGSYQQVIPRYISLDKNDSLSDFETKGVEFLQDYFPDITQLSKAIFLKGYQWPFNSERIQDYGSSLIDMAVHYETMIKNRRVYLDYLNNSKGFSFESLGNEPKEYLGNSGCTQELPIERLKHLNPKAVELYDSHDIDLRKEPLEIGVCAQHCNGGVVGDIWWETTLPGLFCIGEANGSHGVHRPGGAALNSGQVGAIRAAEKIYNISSQVEFSDLSTTIHRRKNYYVEFFNNILQNQPTKSQKINLNDIKDRMQKRMMISGAYIRNINDINLHIQECQNDLYSLCSSISFNGGGDLIQFCKIYDALLTQLAFYASYIEYITKNGGSRGSFIVIDNDANESILGHPKLEKFKFKPKNVALTEKILEMWLNLNGEFDFMKPNFDFCFEWTQRRSLPEIKPWFENVWKSYEKRDYF